jgi:hypothetical protein
MSVHARTRHFSEEYGLLRARQAASAREGAEAVPEEVLQWVWYDRLYVPNALTTTDGVPLRVVAPGFWNRSEGPDFRSAQIEFGGRLRSGDVEIHKSPSDWRAHGHHDDARYNNVILHVVLDASAGFEPPRSASGIPMPTLVLRPYIDNDLHALAEGIREQEFPFDLEPSFGKCARFVEDYGPQRVVELLHLSGEWRMLYKARAFRERMDRMGADQALYESMFYACGFQQFKHHFSAIARALPYERARQLAADDAALLECAVLQVAGLLPTAWMADAPPPPHFERLNAIRAERFVGLRPLPLEWNRGGVRPTNYPERRLAGAARLVARTAKSGLMETLHGLWRDSSKPSAVRKRAEELFPAAVGFWAEHCTWTGNRLKHPVAMIGPGRVRSILGNVLVPAALALARQRRDRPMEERILAFFATLPAEPDNRILKLMTPRIFGHVKPPRLDFRKQQGMLQLFQDWCEPNPSCRNCGVQTYLDGTVEVER